jgi:hypothetical protein
MKGRCEKANMEARDIVSKLLQYTHTEKERGERERERERDGCGRKHLLSVVGTESGRTKGRSWDGHRPRR